MTPQEPSCPLPIESILKETRKFPPPASFAAQAHIKSLAEYEQLWKRGQDDPEGFWAEQAERAALVQAVGQGARLERAARQVVRRRHRSTPATTASTGTSTGPRKNKAAIIWEGEPGDTRVLTYQELHREVCKFANVLKALGIKKGDRVTIYMPMIPEAAIAMLACARIGATHSVIFGGFSRRRRRRPQQRRQGASWSSPPTAAGGAARSCR